MVKGWTDGGKYYVTLSITQDSGADGTFTVDSVDDYGPAAEAEQDMAEDQAEKSTETAGMMPKAAQMASEMLANQK